MLTIEKSSPIGNKLVVATAVFGIGFIGTLSLLRAFGPDLGQLSSGRENASVSRSTPAEETAKGNDESKAGDGTREAKSGTLATDRQNTSTNEVKPVASAPVDPPAATYSPQPSGSGTISISGQVAPATTSPAPSGTVSQPTTNETEPTTSTPSVSLPVTPLTSLAQPVTKTADSLLH